MTEIGDKGDAKCLVERVDYLEIPLYELFVRLICTERHRFAPEDSAETPLLSTADHGVGTRSAPVCAALRYLGAT